MYKSLLIFLRKKEKTIIRFLRTLPVIIFTLALIILVKNYLIVYDIFDKLQHFPLFPSIVLSSLLGSIFIGNPINSYIIGGYLYKQNVHLLSITAFLLAWVTVGIAQAPVEKEYFGWRFVIFRNILFFVLSIIGSIIIYYLVNW